MATIRKRNGKWQAQVRKQGHPPLSRSFSKRADAESWARASETQIERAGLPTGGKELRTTTLGDLLTRYRDEISTKKRGHEIERIRINKLIQTPLSRYALGQVTSETMARYRDERLKCVKGDTVRREMTILRHLFEVCRRDWGYRLHGNPVAEIKLPSPANARERRLKGDEFERLCEGMEQSRSRYLGPAVKFAIATGMRRGELLSLIWPDIDLRAGLLHIRVSKNGQPRTIPLSREAQAVLLELPRWNHTDRVFPISPNALRLAWARLTRRAGVPDLHFHDLRHEAISRFFERGLTVPEVALISGHHDVRQLLRYTHLRAEDVAKKLG